MSEGNLEKNSAYDILLRCIQVAQLSQRDCAVG